MHRAAPQTGGEMRQISAQHSVVKHSTAVQKQERSFILGRAETANVVDVAVKEPAFVPEIEAVTASEGLL